MSAKNGERRAANLYLIGFALFIWGCDVALGMVSYVMIAAGSWSGVQPYQPGWIVAAMMFGTLLDGHLWRAPFSELLKRKNSTP